MTLALLGLAVVVPEAHRRSEAFASNRNDSLPSTALSESSAPASRSPSSSSSPVAESMSQKLSRSASLPCSEASGSHAPSVAMDAPVADVAAALDDSVPDTGSLESCAKSNHPSASALQTSYSQGMRSHRSSCTSRSALPSVRRSSHRRCETKQRPQRSQAKRLSGFMRQPGSWAAHCLCASRCNQRNGPLVSVKVIRQCLQVALAGFLQHRSMCALRCTLPQAVKTPKDVTKVSPQNWQLKRFAGFISHMTAWASLASGLGKSCPQKHLLAKFFLQPTSWASRSVFPLDATRPMILYFVTNNSWQCRQANLFEGFSSHVLACLSRAAGLGNCLPQKQRFLGFVSQQSWWASLSTRPSLPRNPKTL
mmetsp:Transcript_89960/g.284799  ORF Transcript_89960/g.284799 Transcript_89960/m.284799 type:complete len:366 (-) Transcript_89960:450-1547(-)